MRAGTHGHTLEFVQSMLTEQSGVASGHFKGVELRSAFQPIFSMPHKRAIGFDARLRSTDARGGAVAAEAMFTPVQDNAERSLLELLGITIQLHNFFATQAPNGLLFIKPHPDVLLDADNTAKFLAALFNRYRVPRGRVVIDVPCTVPGNERLSASLDRYRNLGCLVSLDNVEIDEFAPDTIWRSDAVMVKMHRSVIADATADQQSFEKLLHVVSLLHETNLLVLIKGIDTRMEARIAIDADADFARGLYFGDPVEHPAAYIEPVTELTDMWQAYKAEHVAVRTDSVTARALSTEDLLHPSSTRKLRQASAAEINRYREARRPFVTAMQHVASLAKAGHHFDTVCDEFLALPGAIQCYVLDAHGRQVGAEVSSRRRPAAQGVDFNALASPADADWSRRQYFRRALEEPEIVQVTRQYCSLGGYTHCVTFSFATTVQDKAVVVCGDVDWSSHNQIDR